MPAPKAVKKDVVLKVRVTAEQREAWLKAALRAGASDLSTFIRDLVDEEIRWEPVPERELPVVMAEISESLNKRTERAREARVTKTCSRFFLHRKGVYCKECGAS